MDENNLATIQREKSLSYFRIKPECVLLSTKVIEREFGIDWLETLVEKYKRGVIRSLTSFHPIYHGLLAGVVNNTTLEVLELATYIEYLRKAVKNADIELPRIVQELKSEDKYYAYLFQLMVTVRFRLIVPQLLMEPIIQLKQPDILFKYLSTEFIIETTRSGHPDKTKILHDFLERIFFWLDETHKSDKLSLLLIVKTLELNKVEKTLKVAMLEVDKGLSDRISTKDFDIIKYDFNGTVHEFQEAHMPLVRQGKELAFTTCITNYIPFIPENGPIRLPCKTTLVADFTIIEDEIYRDLADKIDTVTQKKVEQLKPLWNGEREIYVFVDIGEIGETRELDMDRVLPRLKANIFDKYPGLLGGVVLSMRIWDNELRRFRMISRPIFSPGNRRIENFFVFRDVLNLENYNDFICKIVGWGVTGSALCSCESGETYEKCCKRILPLYERLISI